MAVFVFEKEV